MAINLFLILIICIQKRDNFALLNERGAHVTNSSSSFRCDCVISAISHQYYNIIKQSFSMPVHLLIPNVVACAQNETRYAVDLNNFGYYADGTLDVNLTSLHLSDESVNFSAQPVSMCVSSWCRKFQKLFHCLWLSCCGN